MRKLKKIFLWFFGILFVLILVLVFLVWLFQDKIKEMAIKELGNKLNAEIKVDKSDLTVWSTWPVIEITFSNLRINPKDVKNTRDVIYSEKAVFGIDFWSVFSDRYKMTKIHLSNCAGVIGMNETGEWNYGTLFQPQKKPGTSTALSDEEEESDLVIELKDGKISGGKFEYYDRTSGSIAKLDSISLALKGEFSGNVSTFGTNGDLHLNAWNTGSLSLLHDRKINLKTNLKMITEDEKEMYSVKDALLKIAGVDLMLNGHLDHLKEGWFVDMDYHTTRNSFESFMSLLPGKWLEIGKPYKQSGQFMMDGWLKGGAGNGNSPDFFANYSVKNGSFQYDGYDGKLTNLNLEGSWLINNKVPSLSHFRIADLRGMLNDHAIMGNLHLKNIMDTEASTLDLAVSGDITLEDIRGLYPAFADSTEMSGKVMANVEAHGRLKDFREKNYNAIMADGFLDIANVSFSHPGMIRKVENLNGHLDVDNGQIAIEKLDGSLGKSDFAIKGTITEYFPWLLDSVGIITARVTLNSELLDLNEWFGASPESGSSESSEVSTFRFVLPKRMDFNLDATIKKFHLDKFSAGETSAKCRVHENKIEISSLNMKSFDGTVKLFGNIAFPSDSIAAFDMTIKPDNVDINKTFKTFDQFAAFALVKDNLSGRFTGEFVIRGKVNNKMELIGSSLYSEGKVNLKNGRLVNFEPLNSLAGFIKADKLKDVKFSEVTTTYKIENEFFFIPKMKVIANEYKLTLEGKHGFDNSLNYRVETELPRKEAIRTEKKEIMELVETTPKEKSKIIIPILITGTVDNPIFKIDGKFVGNSIAGKVEQQGNELKEGGRKEMENTFGESDTTEVSDLVNEIPKPKKDTTKKKNPFDKIKNPFKKP